MIFKKKFDFTIIGSGPMGLYLSYLLCKRGFRVRIVDSNKFPGGHARPFVFHKSNVEIFYHFFYKNDHLNSLKWINLVKGKSKIIWKKINTEIIIKDKIFLNPNNIVDLFINFKLNVFNIFFYFFFKKNFISKNKLQSQDANSWSIFNFGKNFAKFIWIPLLKEKFGNKFKKVSALWLFTRINRHFSTKSIFDGKFIFGYLTDTYLSTINNTVAFLKKNKSDFIFSSKIKKIKLLNKKIDKIFFKKSYIQINKNETVISTIPLFVLKKLLPTNNLYKYLKNFKGTGVIVCIYKLDKKISNAYWTSVSMENLPFNAIIQQNRLYPKSDFEIVYTSKYISKSHKFFKKNNSLIAKESIKAILTLYPHLSISDIKDCKVFKSESAAPIPTIDTINNLPDFRSPINNLWHGGLEYIYPEDRGVGNSIDVANKIYKEIISDFC
jgi:protoporphyrinogen oxidase